VRTRTWRTQRRVLPGVRSGPIRPEAPIKRRHREWNGADLSQHREPRQDRSSGPSRFGSRPERIQTLRCGQRLKNYSCVKTM
jgi:hypothetical protein